MIVAHVIDWCQQCGRLPCPVMWTENDKTRWLQIAVCGTSKELSVKQWQSTLSDWKVTQCKAEKETIERSFQIISSSISHQVNCLIKHGPRILQIGSAQVCILSKAQNSSPEWQSDSHFRPHSKLDLQSTEIEREKIFSQTGDHNLFKNQTSKVKPKFQAPSCQLHQERKLGDGDSKTQKQMLDLSFPQHWSSTTRHRDTNDNWASWLPNNTEMKTPAFTGPSSLDRLPRLRFRILRRWQRTSNQVSTPSWWHHGINEAQDSAPFEPEGGREVWNWEWLGRKCSRCGWCSYWSS